MDTPLRAILTDRATPRLDFVGVNAFTIHLYALVYTNRRVEYIIIPAESFSSNERRIRNSEAEFRNSAFYSRPADTSQLQCDFDHLSQWAQTWQMKFNLTKCTVIK